MTKKFVLILSLGIGLTGLMGCSTHSVLPDKEDIKTSREKPDDDCEALGKVTGNSISTKATPEQVLEDMKQEAANKGANYVMVEQYSPTGTSVTGLAYKCP
ncbi:MAG: DUF4156 domain-containing protein [Bdellovibrionaceae bacterium]|nr:DUF4156 domain-containing protein [Bdellovibrionales bacterium]MCB9084987.1 DUF4156 domain-containing protein [Pseudobdellovibrionaceae bacterium]